ncbi:protein-tyrosine phosphatase [Clostridium acetobutylicum]|uniref:Protein-tyrosine-phosphatase, YWLE B.subtilis ortholog n=1 Tax=Clostridium acetobutylicum (strain ATCC 824 / DSM 792 / JCM 1419 / IAM 19013 / LMG 5710 / NBRC 13948 / NRRL B-527 / VKM B-1787 / 2291 / W) TaxID=272562 RepID=Q97F71_CLOAB|nr:MULTISPECIES: low molecular weight protein arginine phosphatase [Clostridium]AAK80824.1 Protein-tyrosine-phosphatase, YWLE B.subtilis ortholog [Clostridium acetobutylicum ATCC 824]ADZ21925.1 Protein-tyrosine-phosphatase [Clostridium acetobutylicum EA 2018]AEI33179.1 protein-tyrosine-phosphatase [Clostridium acetobutylicum DSM 1731]AWV78764.1 low molecular weight protein arginine phosphatase [Clostridium acetobutylicum]MBC2393628.1 low molecular weight protein arginine phosphatase [Clostridi
MKILFVCTGNTCRSCMAEAMFNSMCNIDGIEAFSAGASAIHGSKTSLNSAVVVRENLGKDISNRKAIQLTTFLVDECDLVLTMTSLLSDVLRSQMEKNSNKIYSLSEYTGVEGDITDPYGRSVEIYRQTYKDIEKRLKILIKKLNEDRSI